MDRCLLPASRPGVQGAPRWRDSSLQLSRRDPSFSPGSSGTDPRGASAPSCSPSFLTILISWFSGRFERLLLGGVPGLPLTLRLRPLSTEVQTLRAGTRRGAGLCATTQDRPSRRAPRPRRGLSALLLLLDSGVQPFSSTFHFLRFEKWPSSTSPNLKQLATAAPSQVAGPSSSSQPNVGRKAVVGLARPCTRSPQALQTTRTIVGSLLHRNDAPRGQHSSMALGT